MAIAGPLTRLRTWWSRPQTPPGETDTIPAVPVSQLHTRLGFKAPLDYPRSSLEKPLTQWLMETDDSPIFRYLYRNLAPRRHLEFGTWQGQGVVYCLEECEATVWTINLLEGEPCPLGGPKYFQVFSDTAGLPPWANRSGSDQTRYVTDALGFIGRFYRDKGLAHRVCQVYCDSRRWDNSNYPDGFFDTALIDGGHFQDIVTSDTRQACRLVRSGGVILWHDYCPDPEVRATCGSVPGVVAAIDEERDWLRSQLRDLFWIQPSWILVGVKR